MSHNKTNETIIEATFALLAEHGLEKTSLSMIAKEVGISKPAIYYHFPSKEALMDYIFDYIFADHRFSAYFPMGEYKKENFRERLTHDGLRMLDEYSNNKQKFRVVNEFLLSAAREAKYKNKLKSVLQESLDGFSNLLNHGVELGAVPPGKTTANAYMLALVIDSMSGYILLDIECDYAEIWEECVRHVMRQNQTA